MASWDTPDTFWMNPTDVIFGREPVDGVKPLKSKRPVNPRTRESTDKPAIHECPKRQKESRGSEIYQKTRKDHNEMSRDTLTGSVWK